MSTVVTNNAVVKSDSLTSRSTTCASLLLDLKEIWDEIGETDDERDKMLLQLEQECLDIYRRKVEKSRKYRAELHQSLLEAEAEVANIVSALGERASFPQYEKLKGTLKQKLSALSPILEELRMKKQKRIKEFSEIQLEIDQICAAIAGNDQFTSSVQTQINEHYLTCKKLGELKSQLQELQSEKTLRMHTINSHLSTIHELSGVMAYDFSKILAAIHPSLIELTNTGSKSKSISNETLARLKSEVDSLKQEKRQRLQKLQELGSSLIELWNLLETSAEEQKVFDNVTCLLSSSVDEVSMPGCLALDVINQVEAELQRLNLLKSSKMKELIFKRKNELEEIYKGVHMDVDSEAAHQILVSLVHSADVNLSGLLSSMDEQIAKAKEQALGRKDILEKVEKWIHASEEENWLDEYERDQNRYNSGRGAHKNLKRAEKARVLVSKMPSLVENLVAKVKAWEIEKGIPFLYDKTPLLHMLEEYTVLRREKEEEKRRSREQKRLQEQFVTEQETLFGSKLTIKRPLAPSTNPNALAGTPISRRVSTPRHGVSGGKERRESGKAVVIPVNYVALPKEDSIPRGV